MQHEPRGGDGVSYDDAHKVLVTEDGIIRDLDEVAAEHLGAPREQLIGTHMQTFVDDDVDVRDNPRVKAMFDHAPLPPVLRTVKKFDGSEAVVLVTAVPAEPVNGQRALWLHSWTLTDLGGRAVTTSEPLGWMVKENWRLSQVATELDEENDANREAMAALYRLLEARGQTIDELQKQLAEVEGLVKHQVARGLSIHDQQDRMMADHEERLWQLERKLLRVGVTMVTLGQSARNVLGVGEDDAKASVDDVLWSMVAAGEEARGVVTALAVAEEGR